MELSKEQWSQLLHEFVDMALEAHEAESTGPVLPPVDGREVETGFRDVLPEAGCDPSALFAELRSTLIPAHRKNGHPGFLGYVCSSADPIGALFGGLAAVFHQNVTAWRSAPGATSMERQVLRWLDEWTGFGSGGQGLLVSGGSMANATAMACALGKVARAHESDLANLLPRLTIYVSEETHLSLAKAARLLGVPDGNVRKLAVDSDRAMSFAALQDTVASDRSKGLLPALVCGSLGTTNTGAIDPLADLAQWCTGEGLWLHVDGAYGAPVARLEEFKAVRSALGKVDSLSLDPHKWLFAPVGVGCLLMRNEEEARARFQLASAYTEVEPGEGVEEHAFFDYGFEMSRPNRALAVWATLKARGADVLEAEIRREIQLRKRFDESLAQTPRLDCVGSGLSVSCFRYLPVRLMKSEELDRMHRDVIDELVRGGRYFLSPTRIDGRLVLRICVVNFRTQWEDLEGLLHAVLQAGTRWENQDAQ